MFEEKNILSSASVENYNLPWNKLAKNVKIKLLKEYAVDYCKKNDNTNCSNLQEYLTNCIVQNRLVKTKDVCYDQESKKIVNIPQLYYNTANHNFSLKNTEKKSSVLRGLTPKKNNTKSATKNATKKATSSGEKDKSKDKH